MIFGLRSTSWGLLAGILGPLGAILGHLVTILGPLGAILGHIGAFLGPSWDHPGAILGPSWGLLGPSWGLLGQSWATLGPLEVILEAILGQLGSSSAILEAIENPRGLRQPKIEYVSSEMAVFLMLDTARDQSSRAKVEQR